MTTWDELTGDIAVRFDLGLKARVVVHEVLGFVAEQRRGIDDFLDKFKAAGLEDKAASWLGDSYPMALSVPEVKKALGAGVIEEIAKNAEVTEGVASKVLGYAIPKIIGLLASDAAILEASPLARLSASPRVAEVSFGRERLAPGSGSHASGFQLVVPGMTFLLTLGGLGYAISLGTTGDRASIQSAAEVAQNAPVTSPPMPSRLAPRNENGAVAASGPAANSASPSATPSSLKPAAVADKIAGDFAIEAGWIKNLDAAWYGLGSQGSQTLFARNDFNVSGAISYAGRAGTIGSLQSAKVPQFVMAALTGSGAVNLTIEAAAPELGSSGNAPAGILSQAALNLPTIHFSINSAKLPASSIALLQRVAGQIKQLPPGTVVQLNGYTDSTGTPAANMELSQRRADSVYRTLIREGVSPAMLSAKGYGSSPSLASTGGIMEGRSSNSREEGGRQRHDRRVEVRAVQQHP